MKLEVGIWNKLTRIVVVLLVVAGVLALWQWYLPLIRQNERMRKQIHRLEAEVQQEQKTSRELQESIRALTQDPKAVERLAREKLGYAKPGETVIRFESAATNTVGQP